MRIPSAREQSAWQVRCGPAWRLKTATQIGIGPCRHPFADPLTREVARYLLLVQSGEADAMQASCAFPAVARAFRVQADDSLVDKLRIMVLGGLDQLEILARTGLPPDDFRVWRKVFFDFQEGLDPPGWHMAHVVDPEVRAGRLHLASRLHLARCGGPAVARLFLDGPGVHTDDPRASVRELLMQAQIACAAQFFSPPESRQELQDILELAMQVRKQDHDLDLRERQFTAKTADQDYRRGLAEERRRADQASADKQAADDEHRAADARRHEAERRADIEKLYQLEWAPSRKKQPPIDTSSAAAAWDPVRSSSARERPGSSRRRQRDATAQEAAPPSSCAPSASQRSLSPTTELSSTLAP